MNITSPPFKDLDENENRKEDILTWKEIYEKLGIKTWNSRTEDLSLKIYYSLNLINVGQIKQNIVMVK